MFRILLPAVAALGLVAFAAQPGTAGSGTGGTPAPTMGWNVHYEGALAKLTYGVAQSDQLAIMVTCVAGDSSAVVHGDIQPVGARMIQVGHRIDPLSGSDVAETQIAISDPWLAGLAERGRMTVLGDGDRFQLRATLEERRLVAGFLAYCAPGRV